jgi:CheY-like chemotaxis protein
MLLYGLIIIFQTLLCDIQMPNMDGYEFLKNSANVVLQSIPLHYAFRKSERKSIKCYKIGAQDYLTKPFNPEEL